MALGARVLRGSITTFDIRVYAVETAGERRRPEGGTQDLTLIVILGRMAFQPCITVIIIIHGRRPPVYQGRQPRTLIVGFEVIYHSFG